MIIKTVTSLKLAVTLLAVNILVGAISFNTYTNYQQIYAQNVDDDTNTNSDTDGNSISFTKSINLTNNTRDSVYGQVASYKNNVYVVWEENNPDSFRGNKANGIYNNYRNYDIYIKKSIDGGLTFSKEMNLSNNPGFSEHPQVAISGNNVYVAWIDDNTLSSSATIAKNKEILFRKSIDGGNTFDKIINLSNSSNADSYNQEIAAAENNVYIVWQDTIGPTVDHDTASGINADNNSDRISSISGKKNSSIVLRASTDGGNTFEKVKKLSNNAFESYPKITAFENSAYVVWNVGIIGDVSHDDNDDNSSSNNIHNGIFFTKSLDNGNSFSDTIKLNSDWSSIGESQITVDRNNVYVVWGGNPDEKNSLNVEVIADKNNIVYVAWQALLPDGNEEILFKKSSDNGATFTNTNENISKNQGISECTSIAVSENNKVYFIWEDDTFGNHEILFAKNI